MEADATPPPNIVLIVSDDHGYADQSRLGIDPDVHTPGLDRLAAEGTTCAEAYVTAPVCSPSRAGLITGRHQARWGATWFDSSYLPSDVPTLAERLRGLGYRSGYLGKVHYGRDAPHSRGCPPRHGFTESFYGLAGTQMGRLHYLNRSRRAVDEYGHEAAWRMAVHPMWDGENQVDSEGLLTTELGHRAREFIGASGAEPFFLFIAFNAVHNFCWQLPAGELARRGLPPFPDWHPRMGSYADWYDQVIYPNLATGRAYYLAQLEVMDAEITELLNHLDRLGLTDNTIVAYTTDNGGSTCNFGDNTPLAGGKYTLYEGGIRVPFTIRWPAGEIPAGASRDGLVSILDLFPTLLAAAGAEPEFTDGRAILSLLRGNESGGHETLHWDCGFQWAVRQGDWKLKYVDPSRLETDRLREIEHADPGNGFELYNLVEDLNERVDLADRYPNIVNNLTKIHRDWRISSSAGA